MNEKKELTSEILINPQSQINSNDLRDPLSTIDFISHHKSLILRCYLIGCSGMLFGWDTGTIGGTVLLKPFLKTFTGNELVQLLSWQTGIIVGAQHIGSIFGGFTIARLADYFGRRLPIVISMFVYIIGILVQLFSKLTGHWYQIAIGRFITGLCIGSMAVLAPMLISETAPTKIRGSCTVLYQLMICFGLFLGSCVIYGTKTNFPNSDASWMVPMGIGSFPVVIVLLGVAVIPESARYYISKNQLDKAIHSLERLGITEIDETLNELRMDESTAKSGTDVSYIQMFSSRRYRKRAIFVSIIMFLQQMSGIDYFFYYGTSLFKYAGIDDSYVTSVILAVVNIVTTIPAVFSVDRFGRKKLLLIGSSCCTVCIIIYSSVGASLVDYSSDAVSSNKVPGIVMIVFTCLFVIFFCSTWGVCGGVLVSEICPIEIKAKAMAVGISFNWGANFFIAFCTPIITEKIHYYFGFVFTGCLITGFFFVLFFIPETKSVSLERINELFGEDEKKE